MKMTINLTESEICKILHQHLVDQGLKPLETVKLDIDSGQRLIGYGPGEHYESYANFKGASVEVEISTDMNKFVPGEQ